MRLMSLFNFFYIVILASGANLRIYEIAKSVFLMRLMSLTCLLLMSCVMCEYGTHVLIPARKTNGNVSKA